MFSADGGIVQITRMYREEMEVESSKWCRSGNSEAPVSIGRRGVKNLRAIC